MTPQIGLASSLPTLSSSSFPGRIIFLVAISRLRSPYAFLFSPSTFDKLPDRIGSSQSQKNVPVSLYPHRIYLFLFAQSLRVRQFFNLAAFCCPNHPVGQAGPSRACPISPRFRRRRPTGNLPPSLGSFPRRFRAKKPQVCVSVCLFFFWAPLHFAGGR